MKNSSWKKIECPFSTKTAQNLRAGDQVLLNGVLYTARDKAHQKFQELLATGSMLPVDLSGQVLYYAGPAPAQEGHIIGSAGPTTSSRMDPFTKTVLDIGVIGLIGKGARSSETRSLLQGKSVIYFSSMGGAGAYLSTCITASEVVAFEELGPEAVFRLTVKDFPAIVINDVNGADLYEQIAGI